MIRCHFGSSPKWPSPPSSISLFVLLACHGDAMWWCKYWRSCARTATNAKRGREARPGLLSWATAADDHVDRVSADRVASNWNDTRGSTSAPTDSVPTESPTAAPTESSTACSCGIYGSFRAAAASAIPEAPAEPVAFAASAALAAPATTAAAERPPHPARLQNY